MAEFFTNFLVLDGFIPHGHCYLWHPQLVGLHVASDTLIAIAYYSIPVMLFYLLGKRQDLPFHGIFLLFGTFIIACGTTHLLDVWTLWHPNYWLSGTIKAIAALISLYTAVKLVQLLPQVLAFPSPAQWEAANWALQAHIIECQRVEAALRQSEERYRAIVEDQTELVCRFLPDGTFTFVNQAYCRFFEKTQEELIGRSYVPVILDEDVAAVESQLSGLSRENPVTTVTNRVVRPNGEIRTQQWINRTIFDEAGCLVELQAVGRDITELKRTEEALRISQARLAGILDIADDAIISIDANQHITLFNKGAEKIFGYQASEAIGQPLDILLPARFAAIHCQHVVGFAWSSDRARRMGKRGEILGCRKDGTEFPAEASISQLELGGEKTFTVFLRDISERKQAEEALRESERRFRAIFDQTFQFMALLKPDGTLVAANQTVLDFAGLPLADIVGRLFWELRAWTLSPEIQNQLKGAIAQAAAGHFVRYEVDLLAVGDNVATIDFSLKPIKDEMGNVVLLIPEGRDISEQQAALRDRQQAEDALKQAYDELEVRVQERTKALFQANEDLQMEIASRIRIEAELETRVKQQAAVARLGQQALADNHLSYTLNEACAITAQTLGVEYCKVLELLPGGEALLLRAGVGWQAGLVGNTTVGTGTDSQAGYTLLANQPITVEDLRTEVRFSGPPLLHNHGVVSGMSVIIPGQTRPFGVLGAHTTQKRKFTQDDVYFLQAIANVLATAINRQQAANHIQASLKEKEVLLKEIHHRVKNNLQVICSLLGLQSRSLKDESTIEILQESQNRVRSMALIHEKLYRSKNMSSIDFADYIRDLAKNLFRSYGIKSDAIALVTDISNNIFLDIDTAVNCGLIINELVSNCLKHAFPESKQGIVRVSFYPEKDDKLVLVVSDNGIGMPVDFTLQSTKTLGLKLVNGLIHQLRGVAEINQQNGTEFKICFSENKIDSEQL